ncbi:MAG: hypothetical protein BJ554DRAFT_1627 [Olpidium bornovanus]|uniref:Uncharacterized protein n=1 Tax=Olpidium bornovanus TaxID=278681 RepID=A0A8H8DHB8_9FUNG|nr:MAG: hypothetical protein BJ554DRAFT_1627 [Olpidium bornovanus]
MDPPREPPPPPPPAAAAAPASLPPPRGSDAERRAPEELAAAGCAPPAPLPPWRTLFTEEEVAAATRVFRIIADNPDLKKHAQASPELAALFSVAREVVHPTRGQLEARRREAKQKKKAGDRAALEMVSAERGPAEEGRSLVGATDCADPSVIRYSALRHASSLQSGIRQMRKVKAVGYSGGSVDIPLPPWVAGSAEIDAFIDSQSVAEATAVRDAGAAFPPASHVLYGAESSDSLSPAAPPLAQAEAAETARSSPATTAHKALAPLKRKLNSKRKCHICFKQIEYLHHFYDQLCTPGCAEFNYTKRFSEANMCGRVCLVTGARVKVTKSVFVAFPHDAARRYAQEPDFLSFRGRLSIYGLDFRDVSLLHHFTVHVKAVYGRLDVLINNAAQTVRRPSSYYAHLLENEAEAVPRAVLDVADVVDVHRASGGGFRFHHGNPGVLASVRTGSDTAETAADETSPLVPLATEIVPPGAINVSAANSQLALLDHDHGQRGHAHFPHGLYDRDDQQVDLREHNSWTQRAGEISTVEMMEVHAINAFAPWVLVSETSAADFAQDNIYMTAVDTGWVGRPVSIASNVFPFHRIAMMLIRACRNLEQITDEAPVDLHERRADAPPPLDEWDGAMRVLDPVLSGIAGEEKLWGVVSRRSLSKPSARIAGCLLRSADQNGRPCILECHFFCRVNAVPEKLLSIREYCV